MDPIVGDDPEPLPVVFPPDRIRMRAFTDLAERDGWCGWRRRDHFLIPSPHHLTLSFGFPHDRSSSHP
jgi:hypothetical protein